MVLMAWREVLSYLLTPFVWASLLLVYYGVSEKLLVHFVCERGHVLTCSAIWLGFFCVWGLAMWSHFACVLCDPGYMPLPSSQDPDKSPKCSKCGSFKPARAHHCRVCGRCVFKMDHHCPWICNCVGHSNQKVFILFLVYTLLLCVGVLMLLVYALMLFIIGEVKVSTEIALWSFSLFVASVFFLFMTADFLGEQLEALETNTTLIETYQDYRGTQMPLREQLRTLFGQQRWLWMFPVPSSASPDWEEQVFKVRLSSHDEPGAEGRSAVEFGKGEGVELEIRRVASEVDQQMECPPTPRESSDQHECSRLPARPKPSEEEEGSLTKLHIIEEKLANVCAQLGEISDPSSVPFESVSVEEERSPGVVSPWMEELTSQPDSSARHRLQPKLLE